MAAGRKLLEMIRAGDGDAVTSSTTISIELNESGTYSWVDLGSFLGISIGGSNDELIFTRADTSNIEYVNASGTDSFVRGIRIISDTNGLIVFPQTTFTAITVADGSTLRFTEIKLTLT